MIAKFLLWASLVSNNENVRFFKTHPGTGKWETELYLVNFQIRISQHKTEITIYALRVFATVSFHLDS